MDAILASRLLPSHFSPLFSSPHRNPWLPLSLRTRRIRIQRLPSKSPKFRPKFSPVGYNFIVFSSLEASRSSPCSIQAPKEEAVEPDGRLLKCIAKRIALALFCFAIGFAPIRPLRVTAVAAPAAGVLEKKENGEAREKESKSKGHEYSDYTRRLLQTVSFLLRAVEEARKGNGDVKQVEEALKAVKAKKAELQNEIVDGLYAELKELKGEKERLEKRADKIVEEATKVKKEYDMSSGSADKERREEMERLEENLKRLDEEYNWIWERVGEIEDRILRRETVALSFGARELSFIEMECEELVQGFTREMRKKSMER